MKIRLFYSTIFLALGFSLFAGRPNDIEFAVQHLIESVLFEADDTIVQNNKTLNVLEHHQKSYLSSQYFKLNFIEDGIIVSSKFPNEVKVIFIPVIEELKENTPLANESELGLTLTIENEDQYFSKKYSSNIVIKIKIICADNDLKSLLINNITANSITETFNKLNKDQEMMRSYKMDMTLE